MLGQEIGMTPEIGDDLILAQALLAGRGRVFRFLRHAVPAGPGRMALISPLAAMSIRYFMSLGAGCDTSGVEMSRPAPGIGGLLLAPAGLSG